MVTGSGNTAIHQLFSYDSSGNVVSVDYSSNGGSTFTTYYYLRNAQNDIVKIIDGNGATVVEYKYDSWGKLLSTTGSLASTLGTNQPFRYRGYVYDAETGWYYLQSRYYDPSIGRFISADVLLSTTQGVIGNNSFAYCGNDPINRLDDEGAFWETVFDVISLVASVAEVVANPADPWAWAGLVGDAIDLIPFVSGVGEVTRAVKVTVKAVDKADDVIDAAKTLYRAADSSSLIRKSTGSYEIIFESGKNYVGKGGFKRAMTSASQHAKPNMLNDMLGDNVVSITWQSAPNSQIAFINEYIGQLRFGVGNADTYNKIWSPGKKLYNNIR